MSRGNRLDGLVWQEFADDPERLRSVAAVIGGAAAAGQATAPATASPAYDDEAEFPEGRIAFRLHRSRERNSAVIRTKKQQALQAGRVRCEVCDFDFEARYGPIGREFIEVHHTVAISDLAHGGTTRPRDLALVCANCHRMLHRRRPWLAWPI